MLKAIPDIRVVAFATPACADIGVSKLCESVCTSVVLHDDVVPRVTPHAVRALLKDLLCTKVTAERRGERASDAGLLRCSFGKRTQLPMLRSSHRLHTAANLPDETEGRPDAKPRPRM